jgi:hypothetical protein
MSSFGFDDIPAAPVFERCGTRSGYSWNEIDTKKMVIPECHPHDLAWIISILHGVTTKSLGQTFEAPSFTLSNAQISALSQKYSKFYASRLEELSGSSRFNVARREANTRLAAASANFSAR